jgi:pyruvate dehydrogenase E2 component (dihydrolipoamide acetyltransferase)
MGIDITVPEISGEPAEVYLSEWLVGVGDDVEEGAPIALIEADKAQVEIMVPAAGRVVTLHVQPDDQIRVGQVIAVLESL